MHIDDLCACGLDRQQATELWPQIEQAMALAPSERFLHLARHVLSAQHPFALHQLLYRACSSDGVVWAPDERTLARAHAAQPMRERGLDSHRALHAWSVEIGRAHV